VKLADALGAQTGWQLQYAGISDAEVGALSQFFQTCEGSLNGFTFVDPSGNLLAWSEDLTDAAWQLAPLMTVAPGVTDPFGGHSGFHLSNSGAAAQGISQTLNATGAYAYSFSVYVKAAQPASVMLTLDSHSKSFNIGATWSRISLSGTGNPTTDSIAFSVQIGSGAIDIFGPQVDAQPNASVYKKSTTGGVYQNARFQSDSLTCTSTAPNQNSAVVSILYANHL
jgi:hypothetical protein